jgi:hypothetical protein
LAESLLLPLTRNPTRLLILQAVTESSGDGVGEIIIMKKELTVIGIIPQYPRHSQNNIYAKVKMPSVGILAVMSQIAHHPRCKNVYAIDENNYGGPLTDQGAPDYSFLQAMQPAHLALFYGGMSNAVPRLFKLARQYQGFGAITIAGGSHVDALPEEALMSGIDIVVHGEGEETITELMALLAVKVMIEAADRTREEDMTEGDVGNRIKR